MNKKNKEKKFLCDVIEITRDSINLITTLGTHYRVNPYSLSHGLIRSASLIGAAAVTSIYNQEKDYESKVETADKVSEIFRDELTQIIINVESTEQMKVKVN